MTLPALTMGPGMVMLPGPLDICKVPVPMAGLVPMPFPNLGTPALVIGAAMTVLIDMKPTVTMMATIPLSNGDQPGIAGGVISFLIMGPIDFRMGSFKVLAKGKGVVTLTGGMTTHNGKCPNAFGGMVTLVGQFKVLCS